MDERDGHPPSNSLGLGITTTADDRLAETNSAHGQAASTKRDSLTAPPLVASTSAPAASLLTTSKVEEDKTKEQLADLSSQVTSLNNKLVQSYNRVGGLEDEIHHKNTLLKDLQTKIERLEAEQKAWEDKYEGGLLVEKVSWRRWQPAVSTVWSLPCWTLSSMHSFCSGIAPIHRVLS